MTPTVLAWFNGNVDTTDILILAGILGYLVDRVVDGRGWSQSSKSLRAENNDLLRRNTELESTVQRHEETIRAQAADLAVLNSKVQELQVRDQQAVLDALRSHEIAAEGRYERTKQTNAERHVEHVGILRGIAENIALMASTTTKEES